MENEKVTQRQLLAVTFVCQLSPIIRLIPATSVEYAGRGAWVSVLVAVIPSVLYTVLLCMFVKHRREGEGMGELMIRCTGNIAGKVICTIYLLWMLFYSGFILRTASERILSTIFNNGSLAALSLIMLFAVLSTLYGGIKAIAGMGEVLCIIIGVVLAITLFMAAQDIKIHYLLPVTPADVPGILAGVEPMFNVSTLIGYTAFLSGYAKKDKNEVKTGVRWGLYAYIIIFAITVCSIGTMSAALITRAQNPFFTMIKNVSVFSVIERMESVVIGMWVFTDFVYLIMLMNVTYTLFSSIIGKKEKIRNYVFLGWGAVAFAVSFLISRTALDMGTLSKDIIPMVNLFLMTVLIFAVWAVGKLRKKI